MPAPTSGIGGRHRGIAVDYRQRGRVRELAMLQDRQGTSELPLGWRQSAQLPQNPPCRPAGGKRLDSSGRLGVGRDAVFG